MNAGSRVFFAAFHPARAYLLEKGLYALLAFDAWLVMLEHGGRYGAGGFNVAHFAWIDRLLPLPSPALYVGLLIGTGLAALTFALAGAGRGLKLALALAYTASWAISLHDSYQHHYLLSWLLLWMAFVPEVGADEARLGAAPLVRGSGVPMSAITCAIVYGFTGLSKLSPEWRSGAVLVRLMNSGEGSAAQVPALIRELAQALGWSEAGMWQLLALSLVALQWGIALGYLAAIRRDEGPSRSRAWLCAGAWLGSLLFHGVAELAGVFEIGWFSYYMLWISAVLLGPAAWLARCAGWLSWPARRLARALPERPGASMAVLLAALSLLVLLGLRLDLPGALGACASTAVALGGAAVWAARGARWERMRSLACSSLVAACLLAGSLMLTSVRFDFYRRWAGEVARLGEHENALVLYRKAERYAPPGRSRAGQIRALERQLAAPRRASPSPP